MFTPTHLQYLDKCDHDNMNGWPDWIDKDARPLLVERMREVLQRYGPLPLHTLERIATSKDLWPGIPECISKPALWDARYAVAHRALVAAEAEQIWQLTPLHWRKRFARRWDDDEMNKILDSYGVDRDERWQPLGSVDEALCYDNGAFVVRIHAESRRWRVYVNGIPLRDSRNAVRSWKRPSAACRAGLAFVAEAAA